MTSNALTPTLRINGYPVPTRYGTQDLPVYAGPNHLDMQAQWMLTYGQASLDTTVAPGQVVEVWYASPLHQFARGNIGFAKQPRPGMGCLWVVLGFAALCVAVVVVGQVVSALSP